MLYSIYNSNTSLNFFDRERLTAERTIIENQNHDIIKNYGIDVFYISQKKNFSFKTKETPSEYSILFHAYGDIIKPEYNLPFKTRAYVQFENDLFNIDFFGLSNDLSLTCHFNKIDFALDSAIFLADDKIINKKIKLNNVVINNKNAIINFEDKETKFKLNVDFNKDEVKLVNFEISNDFIIGNDTLYTSYKKRYSAKDYVKDSEFKLKYSIVDNNENFKTMAVDGEIDCEFIVKDITKPLSKYERRITPAVGDIILIQTVDNKFEKIEIVELASENKTINGLNPLLANYSYQCYCKPFIADNASKVGDLDGPTELNAFKLDNLEELSQEASMTAGKISRYKHLYKDVDHNKYQQDDIYGGYDTIDKVNSRILKLSKNDHQRTIWHYYEWGDLFKNKKLYITVNGYRFVYTADELYHYITNIFGEEYINGLNLNVEIDYSMFDMNIDYVEALNGQFYLDDNKYYLRKHYILRKISEDSNLLQTFIDENEEFVDLINQDYAKKIKSKYKLACLTPDLFNVYKELVDNKKIKNLVKVKGKKYKIVEKDDEIINNESEIEYEYIFDGEVEIIVDLQDIEQTNMNSDKFTELLVTKNEILNIKTPLERAVKIDFIKGKLITVHEFGDYQNTRLATNGLNLYVESHDISGKTYRYRLDDLTYNNELDFEIGEYDDKTISLTKNVSWITNDNHGIYFNSIDKKIILMGDDNYDHKKHKKSDLRYLDSNNSNSMILSLPNFGFNVKLTDDIEIAKANNLNKNTIYIYVIDELEEVIDDD